VKIILLMALVASAIVLAVVYSLRSSAQPTARHATRFTILVDNEACPGLYGAWGLSIYVETPSATFLFDTGPSPDILRRNSLALGIDLRKVDFVVISHEHGDHSGGLPLIAELRPGTKVYLPAHAASSLYSQMRGLEPVPVNNTVEVADGVYIIGELYGPPYEIAVAVETEKGLVVLTGCSHPGVLKIAAKAMKDVGGSPYMIMGGFHMAGAPEKEVEEVVEGLISMGFRAVMPLHCSGEEIKQLLRSKYPDRYVRGCAGLTITVGS